MHKGHMKAVDYLIIDENKIIKDLEWNASSFLTCPQTKYGLQFNDKVLLMNQMFKK